MSKDINHLTPAELAHLVLNTIDPNFDYKLAAEKLSVALLNDKKLLIELCKIVERQVVTLG